MLTVLTVEKIEMALNEKRMWHNTLAAIDVFGLQVHLQEYNAKHAQIKILPRYKVKTEGEAVR